MMDELLSYILTSASEQLTLILPWEISLASLGDQFSNFSLVLRPPPICVLQFVFKLKNKRGRKPENEALRVEVNFVNDDHHSKWTLHVYSPASVQIVCAVSSGEWHRHTRTLLRTHNCHLSLARDLVLLSIACPRAMLSDSLCLPTSVCIPSLIPPHECNWWHVLQ